MQLHGTRPRVAQAVSRALGPGVRRQQLRERAVIGLAGAENRDLGYFTNDTNVVQAG